jgi:hypothetical protein
LAPLLAGVAVAAIAVAAQPREAPPPARPAIAPARMAGTSATDCVPCHAREVSEWERSAMAFATRSPMFGALESVVEEQVGRSSTCPNGAGVLRKPGADACRDDTSGLVLTGTGGEHWCVNCHAPGENLRASMPPWRAALGARDRSPLRDLLSPAAREGISCAVCHQTVGPVSAHASRARGYEGNPTWTSPITGAVFAMRPEDALGRLGIANSGYVLDPGALLRSFETNDAARVHARSSQTNERYIQTSEFCGACHDVRLFGTDAIGARERGEHFKRLRNAYSEWRAWADRERASGRSPASCVDCHMSQYPGRCASGGAGDRDCPSGTHFVAEPPGSFARALVAPSSPKATAVASHAFTSVDIPLSEEFAESLADDRALDPFGVPVGLRARRDMLLRRTFRFAIERPRRNGASLEIPVVIENVGAGHRVPAGFSQEREIWVELTVRDARGSVVYEVGRLSRPDEDLRDKIFARVTTDDSLVDSSGRPLGVFGADVIDGPDVPAWSPSPSSGATSFRGKGLVNLQNGFLRCVRCVGFIDGAGVCQPRAGQGRTRADRFADGAYDIDTGECRSNLSGGRELFETYFPVGSLDADRGIAKAPDAIIDTRSAPPGVPLTYTYVIDAANRLTPFTVSARLWFRAFPPYLVRAFAAYEASKARSGQRPSGPQMTAAMLKRVEPVAIAEGEATIP